MRFSLRYSLLAPSLLLLCAVGFVLWVNASRIQRVMYVTELAGGSAIATDRASATGHADGLRVLIAPERNNESYQWILQTQQMLTRGEWRVRRVEYDNAPLGRTVYSPSPYRWWLSVVAWFDQSLSIRPLALSVERAALFADPALHLMLLIGTAAFVGWRFGFVPAAILGFSAATLFPFASAFLPGQPGDHGWIQAAIFWSVAPLLVGLGKDVAADRSAAAGAGSPRSARRWFLLAGAIGGFALWLSVASALPILLGIAAGGLAAAALTRRDAIAPTGGVSDLPWRAWALGGAAATLLAYVLEYAPGHMGRLQLETVHPLHGLAWLGGGELLVRAQRWIRHGRPGWSRREIAGLGLALAAVLALPIALLITGGPGLFATSTAGERLSNLPNAPVAPHLAAWLSRDGVTAAICATLLPLSAAGLALWLLIRRQASPVNQRALAVALGPVLLALGIAVVRLRWWGVLDSALLALLLPLLAAIGSGRATRTVRWIGIVTGGIALLLGARLVVPPAAAPDGYTVTSAEVEALIERDLAHWLSRRAGPGAIVFAPPQLTASFIFHGGLRGLGTPYPENRDGFAASVRIASATAIDETLALVQRRGITHIVLPSWDPFLDEYARLGAGQPENSFIGLLHRWMPPRWLRPIAYQMPQIPGFESQSVAVFEVVEVQENTLALSRLAEYFVETGRMELALSASYTLGQHFADDLGATVARTQVEAALGDTANFRTLLATLETQLAADGDQYLPWDRRVSLAIVLAQAKRYDQARDQVERCVAELDEARLRSLTTVSLYRLQRLLQAFQQQIPDPRLRALARALLSPELRETL